MTKEHLTRLILKAGIQSEEKTIHNLSSLGLDVFNTPNFVPRKVPQFVEFVHNYNVQF